MNDRLYLMPKSSKEAVVRLNARVAAIIGGHIAREAEPIAPKVQPTPPVAAIHAFLGWVK